MKIKQTNNTLDKVAERMKINWANEMIALNCADPIVIHDHNNVLEPTNPLELTGGCRIVDVYVSLLLFCTVGIYGIHIVVQTKFYGPAG